MIVRSVAFVLVLVWLVVPACGDERKKHILILQSYNFSFPATSFAAEGVRRRLLERSSRPIELDTEYLDLSRSTEPGSRLLLSQFLHSRYAGRALDVVIVVGGEAFPFVIEHRAKFAPGVPIVFVGISPESLAGVVVPSDVTGHIIDFAQHLNNTLTLAERLQPEAQDLFLIAGSGAVDRRWQRVARKIVEGRRSKLNTTYLFELTYDELIDRVSKSPRNSIVVFMSVFRDSAGRQFTPADVLKGLIRASSAPIYTPYPSIRSNKGTVGGFSEKYEEMGETAADIALEILEGRAPSSIPMRSSPEARNWVDYESLQRWGLREEALPPDTTVLFKPPTLSSLDRAYVIGGISFITVQSLLIAGLFIQRLRLRSAQKENRRNQSALRSSYEQLRHLAGRLLKAEDSERQRIARELHDDVGQQIASLSIGLSSVKRQIPASEARALTALEHLQKQTLGLAEQMRDLSHDLHHGTLEHLGLPAALRERCEEVGRGSNISVVLDMPQWTRK